MRGIEVRLRSSYEAYGKILCEVPYGTDLEHVLQHVRRWGITVDDDSLSEPDLVGEFKLDTTGAYFEILVDLSTD